MIGWNIFIWFGLSAVFFSLLGSVLSFCSFRKSAVAASCVSALILLAFITGLWLTLDRPPLRTIGETRLWYSFFATLAGLATYMRWRYKWILSFSTVLATVFIMLNIFKPEIHDQTLMPALQSPWFVPHVSVYMFSYALFGCATLLTIVAMLRPAADVDGAIERLIYAGMAFLTFGMLTGALWAKDAWGAYWSWDAKEAWAAVTWSLYLVAMHLAPSVMRHRSRTLYHITLILAFLALQMCWYGVNYLPSAQTSIHTYNQ